MVVITASQAGAALDTDLRTGGGTDDTAVLQAVLDRAATGETLHLILDGPALVSGLDVHGNTTIECRDGAGLYLADGSYRAVLRNANRTRDAVVDRDITVKGGFFNGNRNGQRELQRTDWPIPNREKDGTTLSGLQFFGVDGLRLEGLTTWDARAYAIWIANVEHVTMRDITIDFDVDFEAYPGDASAAEQRAFLDGFRSNMDGIHVNGPARHVVMEGLRLRTEDDALALNANDWTVADFTVGDLHGPYVGLGPITDVVIRDVVFDGAFQGIRILSADQRIDRILIENVSGTIRHRMAMLSRFAIAGPVGDIGTVVFRNINVDPSPAATWREIYPDWYEEREAAARAAGTEVWDMDEEGDRPLFSLNGVIDRLVLEGVTLAAVDDRPVIRLGRDAVVHSLEAELRISDPKHVAVPLRTGLGGRIEHLTLSVHDDTSSRTRAEAHIG